MSRMINHTAAGLLFLSACAYALAADVNLNGIIGNKALVVIDNGKPRWLAIGETSPEGVKLVTIKGESALIELDGKRETLTMGQSARLAGGARSAGTQSVILIADNQGHFVTGAPSTVFPCASWSTPARR